MMSDPNAEPKPPTAKSGFVHTLTRKRGRPVTRKVPSSSERDQPTTDTFATDMDPNAISKESLSPSSSASGTSFPSANPTISDTSTPKESMWDVPLIGFAEMGCPTITGEQWTQCPLRPDLQERMLRLSTDRGDNLEGVLLDIAEYMADSDYAEMPMWMAVEFFLTNELID